MIEPSSSIPVPIEGLSLADIEQIVLATESHSDEIWTRRVAVALKARVDTALSRLAGELREAQRDGDRHHWGEMSQISDAIGSTRFMDPPDGGSPTLAEQVGRMRETLVAAESRATALAAEVERLTKERDAFEEQSRRQFEIIDAHVAKRLAAEAEVERLRAALAEPVAWRAWARITYPHGMKERRELLTASLPFAIDLESDIRIEFLQEPDPLYSLTVEG